jgi:predicted LPLAT superfamily acyltransferase
VWAIRTLGHRRLRILLAPIAVYFCLFAGSARRASKAYLARVGAAQGRSEPVRLRDTYRHIYSFAETIHDRLALWSESIDDFEVEVHGREHMQTLIDQGRGGFLVGAHIGSFDVLRVVARESNIPVNVVMYAANSQMINDAFEALDPKRNVRVIDFNSGPVYVGLEVRRCIERGEFVAVLGDRKRPGTKDRVVYANFLGERAAFPQGPFLLPMVIQIPVILTIAIRTGSRAYEVYLEPLADGEPVPRRNRETVIQQRVEYFAARLEHYCEKAPLQWFNFYDFWSEAEHGRH